MIFKIGDKVKHNRTNQIGTITRIDDSWGRDWIIAADESFRGQSGCIADGFAAYESDLSLVSDLQEN